MREVYAKKILGTVEAAAINLMPDKVNTLVGKGEASLAIFYLQWAPLAKRWGGLIVSFPNPDTILLTQDSGGTSLNALRQQAKAAIVAMPPEHDRLTDDIYGWTKNGWVLVP